MVIATTMVVAMVPVAAIAFGRAEQSMKPPWPEGRFDAGGDSEKREDERKDAKARRKKRKSWK